MKRALPIFLTAMLLLMSCAVAEDGGMGEPADHDIEQKLTQTSPMHLLTHLSKKQRKFSS